MRINRWWIFGAVMSVLPVLVVADTRDDERASTFRWDIIHIVTFSPSGNVIDAGGKGSASAQNKSTGEHGRLSRLHQSRRRTAAPTGSRDSSDSTSHQARRPKMRRISSATAL
jgi:hypothetical protein